jgi:sulfopyruvate decarboxylase TPP-binding subunit
MRTLRQLKRRHQRAERCHELKGEYVTDGKTLSATEVVETLIDLGATHLLGIPDNDSAALFEAARHYDALSLLTVTREGEAFAMASGLWIGGQSPVVSIQNTGLLESGDSLRGTAVRMGIPLICLVGYRGFAKMRRAGLDPNDIPPSAESMRRSDVDSPALVTEPTLTAWGIPFYTLEPGRESEQIRAAWNQAREEERPVALLVTLPFISLQITR